MTREVWLVEVHSVGTDQDPWLLLTDWPGTSEQSAARISAMYRERQGRRGQLQVFENASGLSTLVALGWVAAGFLYGLGKSPGLG